MMVENSLIEENRKKLELETQSLSVLKDMSQKCIVHTASIRIILSEFDNRLSKLEKLIQPIYRESGNLQSKQSNLVRTLENLDYIIQFYSVTNEVESIIHSGPANQLDLYMRSIDKLEKASKYFSENNTDSPEYINIKTLSSYAHEAIKKEFRNTLQRYSTLMPPIALLDLISDDNPPQKNCYYDMTPEKIEELQIMSFWLCQKDSDQFISTYADLRSEYIAKSLKSLFDYQKSRSIGPATTNLSNVSSRISIESPDLGSNKRNQMNVNKDPIFKRTPKSIQMALKRKFHADIAKNSNSSSFDDNSISDSEVVSYLTCLTGFLKLSSNEQDLMSSIVPSNFRTPIFNELIQASLSLICNEADNLVTRVKKSVKNRVFKSSLNLFPILRHQMQRKQNFDLLFDNCHSEPLSNFQKLIVTFKQTLYKSLCEFSEFVRCDETKVPDDGTVHELTNNVMIFIEQLSEYLDIITDVVPIREAQPADSKANRSHFSFAQYVCNLLTFLDDTLQTKSRSYYPKHSEPSDLSFLFKMNNYHYILKRLKESDLLEIIHSYNDVVEDLYTSMIAEQRKGYFMFVSAVADQIPDLHENENRVKCKEKWKEGFINFKTKFTEFSNRNRRYTVPDIPLRALIREESKRILVPRYSQFHHKLLSSDLFKNKEKYVKFNPHALDGMIDEFFESD